MNLRGGLFLVAGGALLAALFVMVKPEPAPAPATEAPAVAAAPAAAPAPVAVPIGPKLFDLAVRNGRLESGPAVIKVSEGDELIVRITTDQADDLHLHGYDLHVHLKPGAVAELRLTASRSGRFEYELHKAHVDLGVLEVHPR